MTTILINNCNIQVTCKNNEYTFDSSEKFYVKESDGKLEFSGTKSEENIESVHSLVRVIDDVRYIETINKALIDFEDSLKIDDLYVECGIGTYMYFYKIKGYSASFDISGNIEARKIISENVDLVVQRSGQFNSTHVISHSKYKHANSGELTILHLESYGNCSEKNLNYSKTLIYSKELKSNTKISSSFGATQLCEESCPNAIVTAEARTNGSVIFNKCKVLNSVILDSIDGNISFTDCYIRYLFVKEVSGKSKVRLTNCVVDSIFDQSYEGTPILDESNMTVTTQRTVLNNILDDNEIKFENCVIGKEFCEHQKIKSVDKISGSLKSNNVFCNNCL